MIVPASLFRRRLSVALLGISFFLIGFFSAWSDAPPDRYKKDRTAPTR
jgi:hypothetical protein